MTVTFYGVAITIESASAQRAYADLCDLLDQYDRAHGGGIIEWQTDTYAVDDGEPRESSELWAT